MNDTLNRDALQIAMDAYEGCFPDAQGVDYDGLKVGIAAYLHALSIIQSSEISVNEDEILNKIESAYYNYAKTTAPMRCFAEDIFNALRPYLSGQKQPSEISVNERGTIEHLVKREIPQIALQIAETIASIDGGKEVDEITIPSDLLPEIQKTLERSCYQLESVMLATKREIGEQPASSIDWQQRKGNPLMLYLDIAVKTYAASSITRDDVTHRDAMADALEAIQVAMYKDRNEIEVQEGE